MNRTHRSFWNSALGAWVAVPENARTRGKRSASHLGSVCALMATMWCAGMTCAHACTAGSTAELAACIAGSDQVIDLTASIVLNAQLPVVERDVTINGNGHSLDGAERFRGFFIGSGTTVVNGLTMQNLQAQGGQGGTERYPGGGGMGAGGAVFVATGAAADLNDVIVVDNRAIGGDGGSRVTTVLGRAGGGGMGGDGSSGLSGSRGGDGGGGLFDNGMPSASGSAIGGNGGGPNGGTGTLANGNDGGAYSGGAGGGRGEGFSGGDGGLGGGGGGSGDSGNFSYGGNGGFGGGGGGGLSAGGRGGFGDGGAPLDDSVNNGGGVGGGGGMGGNGGGSIPGAVNVARGGGGLFDDGGVGSGVRDIRYAFGGIGGGPAGGAGGDQSSGGDGGLYSGGGGAASAVDEALRRGGTGGFGGGGGGGARYGTGSASQAGGAGGFGGGGGGGVRAAGAGGFGGGGGGGSANGSSAIGGFGGGNGGSGNERYGFPFLRGGGGGAGMGGAIFVVEGGSLTFSGTTQVSGNSVAGGIKGSYVAQDGLAFGAGIFMQGNGTLAFAPAAGVTQTMADEIADQTGSGGTGENAGSIGLIKRGGGRLILSAANSYSGGTTVTGGTLSIASDANLGSALAPLTLDGGTLHTSGPGLTTARAITIGSGGGSFQTEEGGLASTGVISGEGGVTKTGTSMLTLAGANSYRGGTRLVDGVLLVSSDANLGDVAGGLFFEGGGLRTAADLTTDRATTLLELGTIEPFAETTLTHRGTIEGPGTLFKDGFGTLVLTGTNTYRGGTIAGLGTLSVSADENLGEASGPLTVDGTLRITRAFATSRSIVTRGTFQTDADLVANGEIAGGSLIKTGAGTLTLAGDNTYRSGTRINEGVLSVSSNANLGGPEGAVGFNGGTLRATGSLYGEVGKLWASGGDTRLKGSMSGSVGLKVRW